MSSSTLNAANGKSYRFAECFWPFIGLFSVLATALVIIPAETAALSREIISSATAIALFAVADEIIATAIGMFAAADGTFAAGTGKISAAVEAVACADEAVSAAKIPGAEDFFAVARIALDGLSGWA